jgi:hypothetical protein
MVVSSRLGCGMQFNRMYSNTYIVVDKLQGHYYMNGQSSPQSVSCSNWKINSSSVGIIWASLIFVIQNIVIPIKIISCHSIT